MANEVSKLIDRTITDVVFDSHIDTIGDYAFANCHYLTSNIVIPDNVKVIGHYAFSNCDHIPSFTIGDGIEELGCSCFRGCYGITSLTFGPQLNTICDQSFAGLQRLESVTIKATTPPSGWGPNILPSDNSCIFYVPSESLTDYQAGFSRTQKRRVQAIPT